jgi:hypothetical protein
MYPLESWGGGLSEKQENRVAIWWSSVSVFSNLDGQESGGFAYGRIWAVKAGVSRGRFITCLGERLKLVLARSYVVIVS